MGRDITPQNLLVGHSWSVGCKIKEKSDGDAFPLPVYIPWWCLHNVVKSMHSSWFKCTVEVPQPM